MSGWQWAGGLVLIFDGLFFVAAVLRGELRERAARRASMRRHPSVQRHPVSASCMCESCVLAAMEVQMRAGRRERAR